jgi:sensor histidine kinase YesM
MIKRPKMIRSHLMLLARVAVAIALSAPLLAGCRSDPGAIPAEKGRLDLSARDLGKEGPVPLTGEWELYWGRLLEPRDFGSGHPPETVEYIELPGAWNGFEGSQGPLPGEGCATLRLTVDTGDVREPLALNMGEIRSAWRLWINGRPVPESSRVGRSSAAERPRFERAILPIHPATPTIELILQISNYHFRDGGVITPILLGREKDIQDRQTRRFLILAFVLGGIIVIGIYHFVLHAVRRSDPAPMLVGAYCMLWALTTLASNSSDWIVGIFLPHLSAETLYVIDIVCYALTVPVLVMFLHTFFASDDWKRIVRVYQVGAVALSLFVLCAPMRTASRAVPYFHLFALVGILWTLLVLVRSVRQRRQGADLILFGLAFLAAAGMHDMLRDLGWIHTPYLFHLGLLFFILSQSIAVARSYSLAFTEAQTLAGELKQALVQKARYEINPHFLFNSLASIRGAVNRDGLTARKMLTQLSSYCRMVITPGGRESIPLGEELEKTRLYLEIEKIRFGDYLSVEVTAAPDLLELSVPPMMLQPLVENAVKYGRRTAPENLSVMVQARREDSRLLLWVSNSGTWVPEGIEKSVSTGTGLRNLTERLSSRYGEDFRMTTHATNGCVRVELDVPAKEIREKRS